MSAILSEIVTLITSGLVDFGAALGGAFSSIVQSIFLVTEGDVTKLSTFGGLVVIFAGLSLCIGITRWFTRWLSSLGN